MDKLPLEMKQRICSFLHASPKLLKPIRLVSKDFAAAAAPYLIPRIFLFNLPESCDEVQKIIQHPVFSKYVTTIAVDVSKLKYHTTFFSWAENQGLSQEYPDWSDFKPQDVLYDEDGDPILEDPASQESWNNAKVEFISALEEMTALLEEDYHAYWKTQNYLAKDVQSDGMFKARLWETVADAFEMCHSLTNLVIAPPNVHGNLMHRRNCMFDECLAIQDSFLLPADHIPPEVGLREILQATKKLKVGLNSLTIVDFPINCADFSMTTDLQSVASLKHIRIGYNRLHSNPQTGFGFNLESVLHAAQSLQTLWIEMPPSHLNQYNANGLLYAINSKHFRDILLDNAVVSEDSMVDFLLRHSDSLQKLDLGMTLSPGAWFSTLHRVSKQMRVLKRTQLVGICEIQASEQVIFSTKWCLEAQAFLLKGGQLAQPEAFDLNTDFGNEYEEEPQRNGDLPEEGLWSDYDANSNICF